MASKTGITERVKAFDVAGIAAGLDARPDLLDLRDERGRTWLHLVAAQPAEGDARKRTASVEIAGDLLARGLDLNDAAFTEGENGEWRATPLWFAVSRGRNLTLARFLLGEGCDPDHCLFAACWNDDVEAIRLLCAHKAPVRDDVFLEAVGWSRFDGAEEMLRQGCDPNAVGKDGRTALHMMLKKDSPPERLRAMIGFGARGDIPDADGKTAAQILGRKRDPAYRALVELFIASPSFGAG
jgi:ankyrin repeat protein